MLQRLPVALAQVQVESNTSETLLKEIHDMVYSLHNAKETIKKKYNIMNSIKV